MGLKEDVLKRAVTAVNSRVSLNLIIDGTTYDGTSLLSGSNEIISEDGLSILSVTHKDILSSKVKRAVILRERLKVRLCRRLFRAESEVDEKAIADLAELNEGRPTDDIVAGWADQELILLNS